MNRTEILDALEKGNYEISEDGDCDCRVRLIDEYGQIDLDCNECWYAKALHINDILIAEYVQFEGLRMHTDQITDDDILDNDTVYRAIRINETEENPAHDMESIIADYFWYYPDAKFYRNNQRGFANEYEIIVDLTGSADPDNISDSWDVLTAEEAAHEIAYDGDAATDAFNSLRIL